MKTYEQLVTEGAQSVKAGKVEFRDAGHTTSDVRGYKGEPIGWFSTNQNPGGFVVFPLDATDLAWFKEQGESTKNVFRIATDIQTNLVKMNLAKNRVTFFDNETYMNTDKITWEKRSYTWNLFIDATTRAYDAFNVDGTYRY